MFSTKALASSTVIKNFSLVAVLLTLTPQISNAQTSQTSDDPPPFTYEPTSTDAPDASKTFICRSPFDDAKGDLFCAGEVSLGDITAIQGGSGNNTHTFNLGSHETVSIETVGALDTFGKLFDATGNLIALNDNRGNHHNFEITRTLSPGRYYIQVVTKGETNETATLHINKKQPVRGKVPVDLTQDIGNHCGRAAEIATYSTTATSFDGPGDIDVYAIQLANAGDLMVHIDGAARYELKAADCATSLGLATSTLGATLAPLAQGTYYLYVSGMDESATAYELQVELR